MSAYPPTAATLALLALSAYFIGSIPFGLIVGRVAGGVDLRTLGSHNIGAANAFRVLGPGWGVAVLLLDGVKGWFPVAVAAHVFQYAEAAPTRPLACVAVAICALIGHNNSVYLQFKGGKGIATTFGVMLAISPLATSVAALVWGAVVGVTRYASLGSLCAAASIPITLLATHAPCEYVAFGIVALLFAVVRHRTNIRSLLAGTELKIAGRRDGPQQN